MERHQCTSQLKKREKFHGLLAHAHQLCVCVAADFAEKTFADGPKTSKFVKVFSLESFPLSLLPLYRYTGE